MAPLESQSVTADGGLPPTAVLTGHPDTQSSAPAADETASLGEPFGERRRPAVGNRRVPWTADPPYLVREPIYQAPRPATTWRWASKRYQKALVVTDVALTIGFAVLSLVLTPFFAAAVPPPAVIVAIVLTMACVTVTATAAAGGYRRTSLGDGVQEYQTWLRSVGVAFGTGAAATYIFDLTVPRDLFVASLPLIASGWVTRYAFRRVLHRARNNGRFMMRTLLVGDPMTVERMHARFRRQAHHGFQVVGVCSSSFGFPDGAPRVPVLGTVAHIPQVVMDHAIDSVVVEPGQVAGDSLRRLSWALGHTPAELIVSPGLVEVLQPRLRMRPTVGLSLLHVETENSKVRLLMKAGLDRVTALVSTIVISPVLVLAALAIKLESRGPVFFRQVRVGEGDQSSASGSCARCSSTRKLAGPRCSAAPIVTAPCSRCTGIPASPGSAPSSGGIRSTSCLSCSTSSMAR